MAGRTIAQRAIVATVMSVAILFASGCGLRWETEPSPVPVADQATLDRDALAAAVDAVAIAAETRDGGADPRASEIAAAQRDALGGVYVAYPDADVTASPTATAPLRLDDAVASLRTTARDIAAHSTDANLAAIATSIDLAWAVHEAWNDADAATDTDADAFAPDGSPLPLPDGTESTAGFSPVLTTALAPDVVARLAVAHDQARFAYETAAAHVFAHERDEALERAGAHGARADALAAATSAPDERTAVYQLRNVNLGDAVTRDEFLRGLEEDLALTYAALATTAQSGDREWLLNAAFSSYLAARDAGTGPEFLTPLPGLTVTDPSQG